MGNKGKRKFIKTKTYTNWANLTDTETTKMHDLLKKGYTFNKTKRATLQNRKNSVSSSGAKTIKNKLKSIQVKGLSNSRSYKREISRSTDSNRKIKSTIASSDIKRSNAFRIPGEVLSVASEKPKAVYFKNTLESHNKIKLSSIKNSNIFISIYSKTVDSKNGNLITPVQNVRLYSHEDSSKGEIEEQLPEMVKFFDTKNVDNSK